MNKTRNIPPRLANAGASSNHGDDTKLPESPAEVSLSRAQKRTAGPVRTTSTAGGMRGNFVIRPLRKPSVFVSMAVARPKNFGALLTQIVDQSVERVIGKMFGVKPAPFASAKTRGVALMKAELEKSENLSLKDASEYSGRADRLINEARQRGELYALLQEGNTRGFRYPSWQFDVDAARLIPVLEQLGQHSLSCWVKHYFLIRKSDHLNGKTPRDVIAAPAGDLDDVFRAIRQRFSEEQGAL